MAAQGQSQIASNMIPYDDIFEMSLLERYAMYTHTSPPLTAGLTYYPAYPQMTDRPQPPPMLDRYLSDSSEDEAADLTGIATAAIDWELPELPRASSSRPGSDIVSVGSSSTSIGSHFSLSGRRKSTLRFQKRNNSTQKQSTGKYQCTFCMATFSIAGNWIRHEEGIHLVLSEWVCSPDGATDAETGLCIFCEPDSCSGSCGSACATKEIGARTFSRKDHLKQHLGRVHHTEWNRLHHGRWKRQLPPPVDSRCGFCGESFNSWAARKTHIAEHFQDGKTMSEWQGDWGLSSEWMERLDSAITPSERPIGHDKEVVRSVTEKTFSMTKPLHSTDKGRNRIRNSVACDNCRRRKIRCSPPQDDSQGRCSHCFRLRIECNFHKLEAGRHRKSKQGVLGSQGSSAASSPSPGLIGFGPLSLGESPHDYTASAPVTPTYGATGISSDRFPSHSAFNANANGQIPLSHSSNVSSKPSLHLPGVGQGHPIPYDEFNWTPGPNENMIHSQNRLWQLFAGLHQHPDAMASFTSLDSTDLQTASTSMSSSPITPMDDSASCFQENICDTAGNSSDWMYGSMFPQS